MTYGTKVISKNGAVLSESKNLRAMRDYARTSPVAWVTTARDETNSVRGVLRVEYKDGATCVANFASHPIMLDWVRARRSWRNASFMHIDEDMGYLTKPGIIAGN